MKKYLLLVAALALASGAWFSYRRAHADPPRETAPPAVDARLLTRPAHAPSVEAVSPLPSSAFEVPTTSQSVSVTLPIPPPPISATRPSTLPGGTELPPDSTASDVPAGGEILEGDALPSELNLASTFYPQAPDGDWSMPWQEACEEASALLVANTVRGNGWTRAQFRTQILDLVSWENERFGSYEHTTVEQTAEILRDYLGLQVVIHDDPTFDDVRRILARGHFIVATFAGKELGNPYYSNGGPNYHAMVIKGYRTSGQRIVTSDVGTRRGEDYVYRWSVIAGALHDYAVPIQDGAKRLIEVIPPV